MIEIGMQGNVVVLIDADNVQSQYIQYVLEFAKYFGKLKERRAYGDWTKPPLLAQSKKYDALEIETVQVNRVGKNATDHYLLIDMGSFINDPFYHTFILVSSDGDFASACQFLNNQGKQIIGIGHKGVSSQDLSTACDQFYFLEDLEQKLIETKNHSPIPPDEVREFFDLLLFAYHELAPKQWRWVSYSELDAKLHEKFPTYDRDFGKYTLTQWLVNLPREYHNRDEMIRRIDPNPEDTRCRLMTKAYIDVEKDNRAHLSHFGNKLRQIARDYEEQFGGKKVSNWIREYPDDFRIDGDYIYIKPDSRYYFILGLFPHLATW